MKNALENFQMEVDEELVNIAQSLKPRLIKRKLKPEAVVEIEPETPNGKAIKISLDPEKGYPMKKGDRIIYDFGNHLVGYVSFSLRPEGSPADAPAWLKIRFAEIPWELLIDPCEYHGEISSSWIQQEIIHADFLPAKIELSRRYAFRYMEIEVLDTSPKYQVCIENVYAESVTSADENKVPDLDLEDKELMLLDKLSLKTMQDCMQDVFEDGPKRDRRLWIGDLRLQALTNYYTFQNNDLVRRCLYLFGGLKQNRGRVGACLFVEPVLQVDDTALFDYSLFFVSCLADYYEATADKKTLEDLYPIALRQIELALERLDENGLVKDSDEWWCFLDWGQGLNKQAGAQAVLIYSLEQMEKLAQLAGRIEDASFARAWKKKAKRAALENLWDEKSGYFISGKDRQISWASQIWMVLARILDRDENRKLLMRLIQEKPDHGIVTPYMMHHFVEALFQNGMKDEAIRQLKDYWGQMAREGADTFFEVYDPCDPEASPYGSRIIHSFCHAWSSTPSYFIRKYCSNS